MRIKLILIQILFVKILGSQNIVKNSSFESRITPYNEFYSWITPPSNFGFNYIDSLSTDWNSLYSNSFTFNKLLPERDVNKIVKTPQTNSTIFKICNNIVPYKDESFAFLQVGYRSKDTINFTPKFWVENTGNPNDSDIYWGYNPAISSHLENPLKRDTSYIISYRLFSGSGIGIDYKKFNFINNFGVHFSVNNLTNLSIRPHDRQTFKIKNVNLKLQDTIIDTSLTWRLIKSEFVADSNFNYIYFGQFLDKRKNKIKIRNRFFDDYGVYNGGDFNVFFAFFIDNIRLLPKWQFLDVTLDKNVCKGDDFSLSVISGSGPYKWILAGHPGNILSTSNFLNVKADTTCMYQVMSPYDTASIMIYVTKPVYDSMSMLSCGSYLWRGKLRNTTGIYRDTSMSSNGCKAYYTLNFKRTMTDNVTKIDSTELRADQDSVSYQWYSCNPWTKLEGETKRSLKGTKGKSYAVVLNNNKGCLDTSDCVTLEASSIVAEEKLDWRVYPNPFQEAFNIELDKIYNTIRFKLYDAYGKLIIDETAKNINRYILQNSNLSIGLYYLQLESEGVHRFFNLKKE